MQQSTPEPYAVSRPVLRVVRDETPPAYDAQPRRAAGFAMIPADVRALQDGFCTAVYDAIASHANKSGEAWPSIERICQITGWSKKVVTRAINKMIDAGVLTKERRFANGMKSSNLYRIPAYGRMVPTDPTMVPTEPQDGSHRTFGWSPQNHELEPIELEPEEQEIVERKPKRRCAQTDAPENFQLRSEDYIWAEGKGFTRAQCDREAEAFINWHGSKGNRFSHWHRAWRNWMARAKPDPKPVVGYRRPEDYTDEEVSRLPFNHHVRLAREGRKLV